MRFVRCFRLAEREFREDRGSPPQTQSRANNLTTCTVGIDWRNPQLGEITARAVALSSRLATTYAETIRGNPGNVGKQLRENSFLTSRSFDLGEEHPDQTAEWTHAIFDARDREIKTFSDRLKLWEPKPQPATPSSEEERPTHSPTRRRPSLLLKGNQHTSSRPNSIGLLNVCNS